ncbi:hypothetical protein [Mesorhizobium sp. GbtcB19]|uniref:hypothetical protein n=1 Tax=Mesorhizobium sp. GbtcB19 TaxID=2824764 RepID=UPI001C310503|nr:hypothetical protein [Mesorhizobium sp. GbtcB19]
MQHSARALLVGSLFVLGISSDAAPSQSPPNTFEGAEDIGALDIARTVPGNGFPYLPCLHREAKVLFNSPVYSSAFFRFGVSGNRAHIYIHQNESPPQTLWMDTYDGNRHFLKEYKGAVGDTIDEEFTRGTYYLQILTSSGVAHNPDGSNSVALDIEGYPPEVPTNSRPGTIPLGNFTGNRSVDGAVSIILRSHPGTGDCAKGYEYVDALHVYSMNAPKGHYQFSLAYSDSFGFNPGELSVEVQGLSDWIDAKNVDWNGGQMVFRVGSHSPVMIGGERFAKYRVSINKQ